MTSVIFGSKAETLAALHDRMQTAVVPPFLFFDARRWRAERVAVLGDIRKRFGDARLAVRSSARAEDRADQSMAGAFHSELDVAADVPEAVAEAIGRTIASMPGDPNDQVLVQAMVEDVVASGVVMTRDPRTGAPFHVLSYDDLTGRTDVVTGGTGPHKRVLIHHGAEMRQVDSPRLRAIMVTARELEAMCGPQPLDIEFALCRAGTVHVLQVRPMTLVRNWNHGIDERVAAGLREAERFVGDRAQRRPGLFGSRTILGNMPDWNPAEIIGAVPAPLAESLYRDLVTRSVWRLSRERMGYRRLPPEELMVMVLGHAYIDVRNSFNSFLPAGLDDGICEALITAWLDRIDRHPEFHDKIEFEIVPTCLDFAFDAVFVERYPGLLTAPQTETYRAALRILTRTALADTGPGSLAAAMARIDELARRQASRPLDTMRGVGGKALDSVPALLRECREDGTLPFAVAARHAFIAESLLRSAVRRGAIAIERVAAFKCSVRTIAGAFASELNAVAAGETAPKEFLRRFGHLRPGTYDILSPRYADRPNLFDGAMARDHVAVAPPAFEPTPAERSDLSALLRDAGFHSVDAERFFDYAARAVAGREFAKFVFTRTLSDVLEHIAEWGGANGLTREEVSFLRLDDILETLTAVGIDGAGVSLREHVERGREAAYRADEIPLNFLLRGVRDIYVSPVHRSAPVFTGHERASGLVAFLGARSTVSDNLEGRIICIENADPGFDWIFTRGIAGLITKFGGSNSHMAIRCAEFGLPAAIGVGEEIFGRVVAAGAVELDCASRQSRAGAPCLKPVPSAVSALPCDPPMPSAMPRSAMPWPAIGRPLWRVPFPAWRGCRFPISVPRPPHSPTRGTSTV